MMKKGMRGLMIAVLAVTLVFGGMTTAFASGGAEPALTIVPLASGDVDVDIWNVPYQVTNNTNETCTGFSYGVLNDTYSKIGDGTELVPGQSTTVYVRNPGLVGMTVAVNAQFPSLTYRTLSTAGCLRAYYVTAEHKSAATGQEIAPAEKVMLQMGGVVETAFYPKEAGFVSGGQRYKPVAGTQGRVLTFFGDAAVTQEQFAAAPPTPAQRTVTFLYEADLPQPYDVTANYVYKAGNFQVGSQTYKVQPNTTQTLTPPTTVSHKGRTYTLQAGQSPASHTYVEGAKEKDRIYTFYYDQVPLAPMTNYNITINYRLDSMTGVKIAVRSEQIPVGTTRTFTIPTRYTAGNSREYDRVGGVSQLTHTPENPTREYNFVYTQVGRATEPYDIRIVYADAATGAEIETVTKHVALNASVTQDVPAALTKGTKSYLVAAGQPKTIMHNFNSTQRTYTVHYNEKDAAAVTAYDLTIRYRNNADNSVLYTATVNVPIQQAAHVTAPERYVVGGQAYILSGGQAKDADGGVAGMSNTILHEFANTRRTYDFFYRPQGQAEEGEQDTETPIEYIVGPITYIEEAIGAAPDAVAPDAVAPEEEAPVAAPPADDEGAAGPVGDIGEGGTPGGGVGEGTDQTSIDEGQTPQGSGSGFLNEDGSVKWGWVVTDLALLGVVVALVVVLMAKRKKNRVQKQAAR